jgi:hypothetical protein
MLYIFNIWFLACYELSYTDLTFSAVPGSDISSLASVMQFSQVHNPSGRTMALGVDSAFNRNEYQEYFLGVKAAGV